jgi:hypothetical protein
MPCLGFATANHRPADAFRSNTLATGQLCLCFSKQACCLAREEALFPF